MTPKQAQDLVEQVVELVGADGPGDVEKKLAVALETAGYTTSEQDDTAPPDEGDESGAEGDGAEGIPERSGKEHAKQVKSRSFEKVKQAQLRGLRNGETLNQKALRFGEKPWLPKVSK